MSIETIIRQIIREELQALKAELIQLNQPNEYAEYPTFLKVKDAAKFLGRSTTKVYEYLKKPDFPKLRIDGTYLIPRDSLLEWMKNQG